MELTRGDARRREVQWEDPLTAAEEMRHLDGLSYLRALAEQRIPAPPIGALLGVRPLAFEHGSATFAMEVGEHLYNPLGSVHGGVLCTLLDTAMGCAVHSTLPAGFGYTTVDLTVHFVKRLTLRTPSLTATAEVVSTGGRVATATGRITGPDGTLYAHASTTCLLLPAQVPLVTSASGKQSRLAGSEPLAQEENGHAD